MKKLILLSFLFITACTTISAHFDNNEYAAAIRVSTDIETITKKCDDVCDIKNDLNQLSYDIDYFVNYSKFLDKNKETMEAAQLIQKHKNELLEANQKGTQTSTYNQIKLKIMDIELRRLLEAISSKVN